MRCFLLSPPVPPWPNPPVGSRRARCWYRLCSRRQCRGVTNLTAALPDRAKEHSGVLSAGLWLRQEAALLLTLPWKVQPRARLSCQSDEEPQLMEKRRLAGWTQAARLWKHL